MYDATFKIILFGEDGTGKTELTKKFLTNLFVSDSKMTIGVDFEVKSLSVGGQQVKLQIWDFGGEDRFRFLLPTYVRGARGGLFIYNVNDRTSLHSIDDWLSVIKKEIRAEDIFPILVVGLISNSDKERQISSEEGIKIAKSRGVNGFIECIVKTGENVEKSFETLVSLMLDEEVEKRLRTSKYVEHEQVLPKYNPPKKHEPKYKAPKNKMNLRTKIKNIFLFICWSSAIALLLILIILSLF